ncbi:MAG: sugar ABC transporter permease [Ruminococcaceae bacterium]|nr:sugar ABC transporter permease [Oscillospiraceae bacterium]
MVAQKKSFLRDFIKKYGFGLAFFMPFFILFCVFVIVPVIIAIALSFTDYNLLEAPKFVGLQNYLHLFMDDDIFATSISNTIIFAFIAGPITFIASFLMAWVINQLKFKNAFALAFYAPSITSSVAMSVVWLYIFSPDRYGLINNFLFNLGVISEPILWNMDSKTILPVIIIIYVWMGMGTGFLVFLAGLQNVSAELYEAGMIDGIRNRFQELVYITMPQMKPQLLFAAINTVTAAFAIFDISVGFAGMPSPNYAGHTIVAHLYDYAFIRFEMGYASAVASVLFFLTYFIGRICMRMFASGKEL